MPSRRTFLKSALAVGGVAATAGCIFPPPTSGPGGTVPGGSIPTLQTVGPGDADVQATTAGELRNHAAARDGRVIWIPDGTVIDLTGGDLVLENVIVASARGEGTTGGVIRSEDMGSGSPTWDGGSNARGLIEMRDNSRITGVSIYGPHHSETDHHAIPGYLPFAPGGSAARDRWRRARYARGISAHGDNVEIDNCEIAYFAVQGISVGSSGHTPVNTSIHHCHIHNCMMTSLGYAIDVRHGHPVIYRCYMDATRHSINGSGMADSSYTVVECTFGPWTASHQIDQHAVKNNVSGSSDPNARNYRHRAGGTMIVRNCVIMPSRVPDLPFVNHNRGGGTPHVHIRAAPLDGFYFEGNVCGHADPSSGIRQSGVPGSYPTDGNGWHNMFVGENQWGVQFEPMQAVP